MNRTGSMIWGWIVTDRNIGLETLSSKNAVKVSNTALYQDKSEAVVAWECKAMVVGSISIWGNDLLFINIVISSLWYLGISTQASKVKHVELRHSTHNASRIQRRMENRILGSLRLSCCIRYTEWSGKIYTNKVTSDN